MNSGQRSRISEMVIWMESDERLVCNQVHLKLLLQFPHIIHLIPDLFFVLAQRGTGKLLRAQTELRELNKIGLMRVQGNDGTADWAEGANYRMWMYHGE